MARVVAAAVVLSALSVALGTESSASTKAADATTTYSCSSPFGTLQVPVEITGDFPAVGTVGSSVQPRNVTVTPTLPGSALADLIQRDAASVTSSARLSVTVAQHGGSDSDSWAGLTTRSTPIPASGGLALAASGTVPPATVTSIGGMAFIAGSLTFTLTPHKADGTATSPQTLSVDCTPRPGAPWVIATVPVPGARSSARTRQAPTGGKAGRRPADDDPCILDMDGPAIPGEAYLAGFSNVNKQHGATLIGVEDGRTTGHTTLVLGYRVWIDVCSEDGNTHLYSRGQLDDENHEHRFPPAKATFLTFNFMPATAILDLTQAPGTDIEIDSHSYHDADWNNFEDTTVTSQLSLRIHDVSINGVPLDVGPHCESVTPMDVTLHGSLPDYEVNFGGPLTGTATIPPFTGCGVGEDLDPLFTASISGPGNFMKLIQGAPCTYLPDGSTGGTCPPPRPQPQP
jgi:hypothetical protein